SQVTPKPRATTGGCPYSSPGALARKPFCPNKDWCKLFSLDGYEEIESRTGVRRTHKTLMVSMPGNPGDFFLS
ncbi:MAG TPA: hypothetical protein P5560_13155, partial [Thermotogota bacterium]|nr:hypothetical protein [Thermotogota bacterium]